MDRAEQTGLSARERISQALPAIIGVVLFVAALAVLHRELERVTWHALTRDVVSTSPSALVAAILLTAVNYAALTGYDFIAFAYIGKRLPRRRVVMTSFLAYAIANNVGFAMWSGASVRYRFYTRWGVTAEELSRIVISYSVTFWLGLVALGGLSLAFGGWPIAEGWLAGGAAPLAGWTLVAASLAYVVAAFVRRAPITLRGFDLSLPRPRLALAQFGVSASSGHSPAPCCTSCCRRVMRRFSRSSARSWWRSSSDSPVTSPAAWGCSKV